MFNQRMMNGTMLVVIALGLLFGLSDTGRWRGVAIAGSGNSQKGKILGRSRAAARAESSRSLSRGDAGDFAAQLNSDGTLKPGSKGSFRTAGYSMSLSANGAPRFVQSTPSCLGWDTQFGLTNGPNSEVFAIAVVGNQLYVGGSFIAVGGIPANRIAMYDLLTGSWSSLGTSGGNGVNDNVMALTVIGSSLYVGGFFTAANIGASSGNNAGGKVVSANRIARYDLFSGGWSALGSGGGNGLNDLVFDLATIGNDLYVGGTFAAANEGGVTVPANGIARLNTLTGLWSTVGAGAGSGVDGVVLVLSVIGTDLYAGGRFTTANYGGTPVLANNIARFNSTVSTWSPLGTPTENGLDNEVKAFAVIGGNLYVGGRFRTASSGATMIAANYLARYSPGSNSWSSLGNGGGNGVNADVYSLAIIGTDLVVGGDFTSANVGAAPLAVSRVVRFNTTISTWSAIGAGAAGKSIAGPVYKLLTINTELYLGGNFSVANDNGATIFANNLVRYSFGSGNWSTLVTSAGNGANSEIYALAKIGSSVYIGGRFTSIGGISANYIARYDTQSGIWSSLGSSGGNGVNEVVLDIFPFGANGTDLYVGGGFTSANIGGPSVSAVPTGYVAKYDTVAGVWSSLGSGGGNGVNDSVYAITGMGNDLYIGGGFTSANAGGITVPVNRLARYNLSTKAWSAVGSGSGNGANEYVFALATLGSDLYAGGIFTAVNEGGAAITANGIARFSTTSNTWSPLGVSGGNGVDEVVSALAVIGTDLYVGGIFSKANFTTAGAAVLARNIARYNTLNSSWSSLGSGGGNGLEDNGVSALTVIGADLYAGGYFTRANLDGPLVTANRVVKYSPSNGKWSALADEKGGNGVDYNVYALAGLDTTVFVGGGFSTAGDNKISTNIGRYCPNSVPTISGVTRVVRQGGAATRVQIATVGDIDQPATSLIVTAAPATGTGVTLSGIAVDSDGNVTASLQPSCTATNSTFKLTVTDSFNEPAITTLAVDVTANSAPVLGYSQSQLVAFGAGITVNPVTGPTDEGGIARIAVLSQGSFTGTVTVSETGVVSIGGAGPIGNHIITIRATDNCGLFTDASFQLNVAVPTIQITSLTPDRVIAGGTSFAISVSGSGFVSGVSVRVNGNSRPTVLINSTRLSATILASDITTAGILSVSVGSNTTLPSNSVNLPVYDRVTSTTATSYALGEAAPDSIVAAFAPRLASGVELSSTIPLPTLLSGTRVSVRDSAGDIRDQPLFFVSPQQVNYLLHPRTALGTATVTVYLDNAIVALGDIQVVRISPGLFTQNSTGEGVPAAYALRVSGGKVSGVPILEYDQSQSRWIPVPIDLGPASDEVYLVLFGSGFRAATGITNISARLVATTIPVLYIGADANYVGLDQMNLGPIPRTLAGAGIVNMTITVDGKTVNAGKTIQLRIK
jgi:trimeric autotransporter adhesin